MNTKLLYAREKLGETVQTLATHPGSIKSRVAAAFVRAIVAVEHKALPDEPRRIWMQRVWEPLNQVKDQHRGSAAASLDLLTDDQACDIAQAILTVDAMVETALEADSEN